MNLQIQHVISDFTGTTGLAIVDAILAGERDPAVLAILRDRIRSENRGLQAVRRGCDSDSGLGGVSSAAVQRGRRGFVQPVAHLFPLCFLAELVPGSHDDS